MNPRLWVLAGLLCINAGCFSPEVTRFQSTEDSEREEDLKVPTIGDVTEVANVAPLKVYGIGLVTNLNNTGDAPKGNYRTLLEQELRKRNVDNVKPLLDNPENAVVLVTGIIAPGVRKGEFIEVEINLPPGSRCTSLRGGYLQETFLRNYENMQNVSSDGQSNATWLKGHVLAKAKGPLVVGLGNPDEAVEHKRGRVWEGGVTLMDRPYYYVLKKDEKSVRIANSIAERINLQFRDDPRKQQLIQDHQQLLLLDSVTREINQKVEASMFNAGDTARAMSKEMLTVRLPYAYRFNPERFWRVSRLIPLRESQEQMANYRSRLEKMLLTPTDTVRAAYRLEALGKDSIPVLKKGLTHEHPLVRFSSAEALSYLGNTAGISILAQLTEKHSQFRYFGLMALANLDESICRTKLTEMLASTDIELRCGAFRALRLMDDRDRRLNGVWVGETFWLYRVAAGSEPLVNFQMSRRPEIVIYGDGVSVIPGHKFRAPPEFTITSEPGDQTCTISRFQGNGDVMRRQSPLALDHVLKTMTDLGAGYPDLVEMLRNAENNLALTAPLRINVLPAELSLEALTDLGRDPAFAQGGGD